MVVTKSQSHPNLLFYGRGGRLYDEEESLLYGCGDSLSSLEDVIPDKKKAAVEVEQEGTSVIGSLLWKLLLKKELPMNSGKLSLQDWQDVQEKHPDVLAGVSIKDLQEYHSALTSIVIMDETLDDRAGEVLKEYKGHLISVSDTITQELGQQAPDTFTAFVADFNDNLAYSMKSTRGIPTTPHTNNSKTTLQQWQHELHTLQSNLQSTLQSPQPLEIQASFLKTEYKTIPQPAHVDYPWKTLQQKAKHLWLAFFGLTQEGMILQLWPHPTCTHTHKGQLVFVPLGKLLLLPSDTIHGGGFRTTSAGNLRYHLYLATHGTTLPRFAQNVYTLPQDKRHELAEVCLDAPHLSAGEQQASLMELLLD